MHDPENLKDLYDLLLQFGKLPDELKLAIADIVEERTYKKGELLLKAGQRGQELWFIRSGLIAIYTQPGDLKVVSWILQKGEIGISNDSFAYTCQTGNYIVALEETVALVTNYKKLTRLCEEIPSFYLQYTKIHELYRKIGEVHQQRLKGESAEDVMLHYWKTQR